MPEPSKIILPVGENVIKPIDPVPPVTLTEITIGTEKFNVNANGEAVDSEGKVIKTKAELDALKNPAKTPEQIAAEEEAKKKTAEIDAQLIEGAEVELDGVKHKLDKDGNVVVDGKVVKTKAELKELLLAAESGDEDVDYVSEIQKATNLTILDQAGKPIIYENTVVGLSKYTQDVHNEGRKLGATEYERQLFGQYPILNEIIEHLTINGSLKGFTEDVDYTKITLGEDEAQHIDIFTKAKKAQGIPDNEIQDMIGYYKTDKKLKSAAETALTYLKTAQTTKATERANAAKAAKDAEDLERTNYWNEVNRIVTSKQLDVNGKKFTIPEVIKIKDSEGKIVTKTVNDFQEYITKPLNFKINGQVYTMTQLEYDTEIENTQRTPHHDLFDAYRKFTKYDDTQLIAAQASDTAVKKIIKLTTKANSGGGGAAGKGGKLVLPIK